MIDTETCSTRPNAALLQVGWCFFDPAQTEVWEGDQVNINLDSCTRLGGHYSDGTLRWWLHPDRHAARASVFSPGVPVEEALKRLSTAIASRNVKHVWAHSPSFDVVILEYYAARLGLDLPWKFWDLRDTRTVFALAEATGWRRTKTETAHTAMADAVQQAKDVQSAWRWVTALRKPSVVGVGVGVGAVGGGSTFPGLEG
jgi:exodeoxyribonuclease VIII